MRILYACIVLCFVLAPMRMYATEMDSLERIRLFSLIQSLEDVIEKLEARISRNRTASFLQNATPVLSVTDIKESKYYDGSYAIVYKIKNGVLIGPHVPEDHLKVWNMFRDILGPDSVTNLFTEFRIFSDSDSIYDAFVEKIGKDGTWILGMNVYDLDLEREKEKRAIYELLVHEYGHVFFSNHREIAHKFESEFWSTNTDHFMKKDNQVFVSEYAATNSLEDAVESFVYFMTQSLPSQNMIKDQKIRFFLEYRAIVDVRDRLQQLRNSI